MKTRVLITLAGIIIFGIISISCQHEPEPILTIAEGTAVCFNDVLQILNNNCNIDGCHGHGEASALDNWQKIHDKYVTPYKPMQSRLHKVITKHSNIGGLMPPKPHPSLSKYDIDIITIWILQGAKSPAETCP